MLSIATWNVNSVNVRLEHIAHFLSKYKPDVILLQETKCVVEKFPYEYISDLGYNIEVIGQKSYNGVAIISKYYLENVLSKEFGNTKGEARYIEAGFVLQNQYFTVGSIYVPNGGAIKTDRYNDKLLYLNELREFMEMRLECNTPFIVGGDYNVAPGDTDVYDPYALRNSIGFHIDERNAMRSILDMGYTDTWRKTNPGHKSYSWWDYRDKWSLDNDKGMRIDHILCNRSAAKLLSSSIISKEYRAMMRPSDHVPVISHFSI